MRYILPFLCLLTSCTTTKMESIHDTYAYLPQCCAPVDAVEIAESVRFEKELESHGFK